MNKPTTATLPLQWRLYIAELEAKLEAAEEMQEHLDEWAAWANQTFPWATAESKIRHLRSEVEELHDDPSDLTEYADCMALLMGAADKQGYTLQDVFDAMAKKLIVNRKRDWGEMNAEGYVEHVK